MRAGAPARTYAAERHKVHYRLTVADISGRSIDREAVFRHVLDRIFRGGKLRTYAEARIRTVHGREFSADWPDGAHTVAAVFIAADRLYELEARAPGPDGRAATGALIRFQQTLNLF